MEVGQDTSKILAAVAAATAQIEESYSVAMVTQTLATIYPAWPVAFTLTRGPVTAVSSIKYTPAGGSQLTLAGAEYAVGLKSLPAMISPAYGKSWPSVTLEAVDPIEVTFVAGYADPAAVPAPLKQAVGILANALYFDRTGGGADPKTMRAVDHLLRSRRLW